LKIDKLRFLDIRNFLAPGFSYAKFLKAYGSEEQKFYFPYEHINCLEKLNSDKLPDHQAFFSSLNETNISVKEYKFKIFLVVQNLKIAESSIFIVSKLFD